MPSENGLVPKGSGPSSRVIIIVTHAKAISAPWLKDQARQGWLLSTLHHHLLQCGCEDSPEHQREWLLASLQMAQRLPWYQPICLATCHDRASVAASLHNSLLPQELLDELIYLEFPHDALLAAETRQPNSYTVPPLWHLADRVNWLDNPYQCPSSALLLPSFIIGRQDRKRSFWFDKLVEECSELRSDFLAGRAEDALSELLDVMGIIDALLRRMPNIALARLYDLNVDREQNGKFVVALPGDSRLDALFTCPHCLQAAFAHYHPAAGKDVACLQCTGKTWADFARDMRKTDPKYLRTGKLHATWQGPDPWPFAIPVAAQVKEGK